MNPISHLVTVSRDLMDGRAPGSELIVVLATATVLPAVSAPLTMRLYASRG